VIDLYAHVPPPFQVIRSLCVLHTSDIADMESHQASGVSHALIAHVSELPVSAHVALFFALVYLAWGVTRFVVMPMLHPDEPKEYPYWLPFFGHLFGFFQDSDALLHRAR